MEVSLAQLVPAIVAGIVGSAGTWFTLARTLVTRAEVERMLASRVDRQEQWIEDMRAELVALRGEVIRLGVLLGVKQTRDCEAPAGKS